MRKQVRPAAPAKLAENAERWNKQWTDLRTRNASAKFSWYQLDGKNAREWILPELRAMNQGHCSFCDAFPLEDRSSEPIEHFRPKTDVRFTMLAFAWENLYYCCELCQKSKREQWDEALLSPDEATYRFDRYFIFDFTTGEIRPNPRATPQDRHAAATTITLYGLNHPARRRYRRVALDNWIGAANKRIDEFSYRDFVELATTTDLPEQSLR